MSAIEAIEVPRLQNYMQETFAVKDLALKLRENAKDSVEVILNGEFIGVISKIEDEGEISYNFDMAILEIDLPGIVG